MSAPALGAPNRAQQGCLRAATVAGTVTFTALVLLVAAWSSSMPLPQATAVPSASARSLPSQSNAWCSYGTLPATWVSTPPSAAGSHWTILDPRCPLQPLLALYADGPPTVSQTSQAVTPREQAEALDVTVLDADADTTPAAAALVQLPHAHKSDAVLQPTQRDDPPTASILFISDSVDRHVLTYLCEYVGGTIRATVLKDALPLMPGGGRNLSASAPAARGAIASAPGPKAALGASSADAPAGAAAAAAATAGAAVNSGDTAAASRGATRRHSTRTRRSTAARKAAKSALDALTMSLADTTGLGAKGGADADVRSVGGARRLAQGASAPSASSASSAPGASLSSSAPGGEPPSGYVVNTCSTPSGRLRLAATYIPGVHRSGPFHKGRTLAYPRRIDHLKAVWKSYAPGPPDIVVVASLLWDLARASAYEPAAVAQAELPRTFLDGWAANYTRVVQYAQAALPEVRLVPGQLSSFLELGCWVGDGQREAVGGMENDTLSGNLLLRVGALNSWWPGGAATCTCCLPSLRKVGC